MARKLLRDTCALAAEIIDGAHDGELDWIAQSVAARKKRLFRPGVQVRIVGSKSIDLDGQIATVIKANARTISIGLGERDQWGHAKEYNVDAGLLQVVQEGEVA